MGSPPKQTSSSANDKPRTEPEVSGTSNSPPSSSSLEIPDPNHDVPGINAAEGEGENIVESLRQQVEHDRNLLNTLYKDLEEERNASAIATNEAMAMITRLQEEKAALHMEALQYLRMMEEQAEYDMEALGRANDMLAEKEKELQDLEIELEFYRNNFLDESGVHNLQSENNRAPVVHSGENGVLEASNGSLTIFEEERAYILQSLKKLEKKLLQEKSNHLPNGIDPVRNHEGLLAKHEKDSMLVEDVIIPLSNGNVDRDTDMNMNDNVCQKGEKVLENGGEMNSGNMEREIRELYERLEALEADRDFVKRTCVLIHNGKDGLELVQEIARQLCELRKTEFKKR
ncbi:Probable myosin-binding protein 4 [Striga hermonthica]|uniref:Probable myosin-binding protein 4 n=1 Tax=Striga hermonthica TaxID=68872 RepID=A0A9N7REK8_STRHE|nr:Probable myosin-binding protein 4 [Striga hermonthica]